MVAFGLSRTPSVGNFEAGFFHPPDWKSSFPNPALERMRHDDAFWATRIVMRFDDDMVRALVRTGQYVDPEAERFIAEALIKRRDKIIRYYLSRLNPLDDFQITRAAGSARLDFNNLGEKARLARAEAYRYQWFRFDNDTLSAAPLGGIESIAQASIPFPDEDAPYLLVEISTVSSEQPAWQKKVQVYIRNGAAKKIVGVEGEL